MADTPQDLGRVWELDLADRVGGQPIPQSGAGARKLDVGAFTLIFSAKWTGHRSIRIDEAMIEELRTATVGAGGVGGHVVPILAPDDPAFEGQDPSGPSIDAFGAPRRLMARSWRAWCCMFQGCEYTETWRGQSIPPQCPVHRTTLCMLILEARQPLR
jgi:hypothetical protein